ncbi:hypothetical protein [Demequina sp.]|uniref:hypothetical protein n=1 Tax=Demequina sp. TaxID=2050685 RepID=UPI003A88C300
MSRRRVLGGAVWAAPAIVVATSIPAAAASIEPEGEVIFIEDDLVKFTHLNIWHTAGGTVGGTAGLGLKWTSGWPAGETATVHYRLHGRLDQVAAGYEAGAPDVGTIAQTSWFAWEGVTNAEFGTVPSAELTCVWPGTYSFQLSAFAQMLVDGKVYRTVTSSSDIATVTVSGYDGHDQCTLGS